MFLCDQDDIWLPSKVARVCSVLETHPDVAMVHHEREVIDAREQSRPRAVGQGTTGSEEAL